MKKTLIIVSAIMALILTFGAVTVFADFGSATEVIANGENLIKTGIFGKKLSFSDTDFKQGLAISDFDSIKITKIPKSTEGTLMLAGRRVGEGTTIRRKNIGALVFIPTSAEVEKSSFSFTISPYADGQEIDFILRFTDKINYEPEIDSAAPTSLTTQRDIAIFGKLSAKDREGDKIEYIIIEYPENGSLSFKNRENGEFCYTPHPEFLGDDSFSYVARDEWGNYSKLSYMTLSVSERMSDVVFLDMTGTPEYNASVALSAMGIMNGRVIGDGTYFEPDKRVSRAEFVTMLMKTMGIRADSTLTETYFDDNDEIPEALVSYMATAQRAGFIIGKFEDGKLNFHPNDDISVYDAASIIRRALGDKANIELPVFSGESTIPVWAREDVYIMCELGIYDKEYSEVTKEDSVSRRECAAYLYRIINM